MGKKPNPFLRVHFEGLLGWTVELIDFQVICPQEEPLIMRRCQVALTLALASSSPLASDFTQSWLASTKSVARLCLLVLKGE